MAEILRDGNIIHLRNDRISYAMLEMPGVRFAITQADFARYADRIPEDRREFIREGKTFELGGMTVQTIAVPGHTPGSVVYFLQGHNLLFTGDAVRHPGA